jgi:hypothetical protein
MAQATSTNQMTAEYGRMSGTTAVALMMNSNSSRVLQKEGEVSTTQTRQQHNHRYRLADGSRDGTLSSIFLAK